MFKLLGVPLGLETWNRRKGSRVIFWQQQLFTVLFFSCAVNFSDIYCFGGRVTLPPLAETKSIAGKL